MAVDEARAAFLSELSGRHDSLLVWKHLDRALHGRGDVDAAAPRTVAGRIIADAVEIAAVTLDASHVVRCDHVADKHLAFFVQPHRLPQLFELDVCVQPSRGLAPWASPAAMLALAELRPDGIRCLRPGAEAVVSLVYHGISSGGDDRLSGDERAIVQRGIDIDLEGARAACGSLPPLLARSPLRALVEDLDAGSWSRGDARRAFNAFVLSGLSSPTFTARRTRFRLGLAMGKACVMQRTAQVHDRQVARGAVPELLDAARASGHDVRVL